MIMKAKDIAKALGVSTATVSLVLNNKAGVSDKRRAEIIEKIKELGCEYMLKENVMWQKGSIGFVIYKRQGKIIDESPFFNYILEGITKKLGKSGYNLNFVYINKNMPEAEKIMQLKNSGCMGLIIFGVEMRRDDLDIFVDSGLPFVILDNSFYESDVDCVVINNMQGTFQAIKYLSEMGHKSIGYIRSKVRINSFEERMDALRQAAEKYGLAFSMASVIEVGYSDEEVRRDVKEYLAELNGRMPTSFFADNDLLGCAAVKAFQENGIEVPGQASVIGFDNRPITTMLDPKLTTVEVPRDLFGPAAVDLLLSKMEGERRQTMKVEVGTSLVKRDSVQDMTKSRI